LVYIPIEQLSRQGVKPFQKKELHDQAWNRTPMLSSIAVAIEPETEKQRTSRYNLKKGGEIWYIYPSNKGK
jgi:hypothetical protein